VVQDDEGGECLPALSLRPLRESILHAEDAEMCTKIKAVRVVRRRETSSASAPALNLRAIARLRDLRIGC
jgi:hypothetical protein